MKLLSTSREVEYTDSIHERAYRATPFWVSPEGRMAYAIPSYERSMKGHETWKPFDHGDPLKLRRIFNYGPVTVDQILEVLIPDAPPFFLHTLHDSKTRVKFGHPTSFGETMSYLYWGGRRTMSWTLRRMIPEPEKHLPQPFSRWYTDAIPHCLSW